MVNIPARKNQKLKALVLCAGKGTRLSPLTDYLPKPLIPIANRPILFYVLDRIKELGITDIGIVVSPGNVKQVQQAVGTGAAWNARVEYIIQNEAKGLAHAVLTAEKYLDGSPFILFLGDNLIGDNLIPFVEKFSKGNSAASILLKEVPDPSAFGVAELDSSGNVIRMEEKPKQPKSNLAMLGIYLLSPEIHEAAKHIRPSGRGELEITDALQWMLDNGRAIDSYTIKTWWLDTGKRDDLLAANRVILDESEKGELKGKIDALTQVTGNVTLGKGSSVVNSRITGPVSISTGCNINNSSIGPHTCIGANSVIENSKLENDIILDNCRLYNLDLTDSLIGTHTEVSSPAIKAKVSGFLSGCNLKMNL